MKIESQTFDFHGSRLESQLLQILFFASPRISFQQLLPERLIISPRPPPGGQRHRDAHRAQVPFHPGEQGETANRTSRAEASLSHVITGQE